MTSDRREHHESGSCLLDLQRSLRGEHIMTHVDDSGRSVTPASEEGLRHDLARLLAAQPPPDWDTEDAEDAGLECSLR